MSFFIIKKIAAPFLLPLPMIVLILLAGLFFLWFTKKQKTGKIVVSLGIFLVIFFSYNSIINLLILPLEQSYPKYVRSDIPVKYVVVLGGGYSSDIKLPVSSRLSRPSLIRLIEGITIYRLNPDSVLIFSGYGGKSKKSNAEGMADVAISLGVPKDDIVLEKLPRDTHEEALLIKEIVKSEPFVLVTSAAHMKRAMMLFKKQDMNPIPAPTDYLVKGNNTGTLELPSAGGFQKANSAIHEYLGILLAKMRGFI